MCLPLWIVGGFGHKISEKKAKAVSFIEEFCPEVFHSHRVLELVLSKTHL